LTRRRIPSRIIAGTKGGAGSERKNGLRKKSLLIWEVRKNRDNEPACRLVRYINQVTEQRRVRDLEGEKKVSPKAQSFLLVACSRPCLILVSRKEKKRLKRMTSLLQTQNPPELSGKRTVPGRGYYGPFALFERKKRSHDRLRHLLTE